MSIKIRPLDDRLVVKPLPMDESKVIVIPDSAKTGPPRRGEVLAVGPGKLKKGQKDAYYREKMSTKIGDVVQFGQYAVDLEYQGLVIIREADVLVVES